MQTIAKFFTAAALIAMTSSASATDAIQCSGKVDQLALYSTDWVTMKLSGMNTIVTVCSLSATVGSNSPVGAQQCKAAYAALLSAQTLDKTVAVWLDNVQYGTGCSNFMRLELATLRWLELNR